MNETTKPLPAEIITEVNSLVRRLEAVQTSMRLSNGVFATRYKKQLGSEKTWIMLRRGDWPGHVNAERKLVELRELVSMMDAAASYEAKQFIGTLPFVELLDTYYEKLRASTTDRRCLVGLAPQGTGKSWWASRVVDDAAKAGELAFYLRISFTWRNKPAHFGRALAGKIAADEKRDPASQTAEIIAHTNKLPSPLFIFDEAHYGGIELMRFIKELIDECPKLRVVYLAFPHEFQAVVNASSGAVAEARQFQRRCLHPICDDYSTGVDAETVSAYLQAEGFKPAESRLWAEEKCQTLARFFNLTTLAEAIEDARDLADDKGQPLSLGGISTALVELTSTADQRRAARQEALASSKR